MSVRKTSKAAYSRINADGTARTQRQIIYDIIQDMTGSNRSWGISLKEIARIGNIEINAVSGRVNDLKKDGKIIECKKRHCMITKSLITPVSINTRTEEETFVQESLGLDVKKSYEWPD